MKILVHILFLIGYATLQIPNPFSSERYSSGYIDLQRGGPQLFYWLQFKRAQVSNPPLILWLQGGPGCSAMNDQFTDIGSFNVNANGTIYKNLYSWNTDANLLFVDQPLGTGMSFCSNISESPNNEPAIARDLYVMLKGVMTLFPELKGTPLYISGHSYGGHFVPSAAQYFMEKNDPDVVVTGISVGDGWVNKLYQMPAYTTYSMAKKLSTQFQGFISKIAFSISTLLSIFPSFFWGQVNYFEIGSNVLTGINQRYCVYNINYTQCPDGASDQVNTLLNNREIRNFLNIPSNETWNVCSGPVYGNMVYDYMNDSTPALEYVLSKNIKTIMYVGRLDWIVNEMGIDQVLANLNWSMAKEFNSLPFTTYSVNGVQKGIMKSLGNLSYLKLTNCGHGVEQDDQMAAFDIMQRLIN